jgi:hypothetical protein
MAEIQHAIQTVPCHPYPSATSPARQRLREDDGKSTKHPVPCPHDHRGWLLSSPNLRWSLLWKNLNFWTHDLFLWAMASIANPKKTQTKALHIGSATPSDFSRYFVILGTTQLDMYWHGVRTGILDALNTFRLAWNRPPLGHQCFATEVNIRSL